MNTWQNPAPVWDRFRTWVSANVNNYHDYASEFVDVENPAFRHQGTDFTEFDWEILAGRIEGDHITTVWQPSEELTTIMRATARRVIAGTEAQIEAETARKPAPPSNIPAIGPAGALDPRTSGASALPKARLPTPHTLSREEEKRLLGITSSRKRTPVLRGGQAASPSYWSTAVNPSPRPGFVMVGGGDYNTYAAMRSARILTYDPEETIKLPRRTVKPYEVIPTEPARTPREEYGEAAKVSGRGEFHAYDRSHSLYMEKFDSLIGQQTLRPCSG